MQEDQMTSSRDESNNPASSQTSAPDPALFSIWRKIRDSVFRELHTVGITVTGCDSPLWRAVERGAIAVAEDMVKYEMGTSFNVTQEVAVALRALRDTGLYGNGVDCTSVSEELLRRALHDPTILPYWRKT